MMQVMVTWFLMVGLPQVLAVALIDPQVDGSPVVAKTIVVQHVGDAQDDNDTAFRVGVTVAKAVAIASASHDKHSADRGWLGVAIAKVPEALSAQFELGSDGLLVANVIEGGPADKAGISEHDVIISVDGQMVTGDFNELLGLLADRKPGDTVAIVALHDGQEKTFEVELGSKAEINTYTWKFDVDGALGEVDEHVRTSGKFVTRNEDGKWQVIDLGDLSALESLQDLPDKIRAIIPQSGDQKTMVFVDDGKHTVKSTVTRDGESISVSQENGGDIVVTRTDVDGNETQTSYASKDDLKAADQEAFDIFEGAGKAVVFKLDVDGELNLPDFDFNVEFGSGADFDVSDLKGKIILWRQEMDEALGDAEEARVEIVEQLKELLQNLKEGDGTGLAQLELLPFLGGKEGKHIRIGSLHNKARQSFEVRPDGTIAVTVRKGDAEVVTLYTDQDDLANRAPELFEKFSDVLNDDSAVDEDK